LSEKKTYLFLELPVLLAELVDHPFHLLEFVLLLQAALQSALSVLEKASLLFAQLIALLDLTLDAEELLVR
jgi:hypothetical protein